MSEEHQAAAEWLLREHASRHRFAPLPSRLGIDTLPAAYEVQRRYLELQAPAKRRARAGYKIGVTSTAMQAMCGIDTPVAGVVFADRVHASGFRTDRACFGRFGIEFEIAVRLARDLPSPGRPFTLADVQAAVDAVAPAIEIVDDRGCDYASLDIFSLIADNAWNEGIVHGEFRSGWPDLADVVGRVFVDDTGVRHEGHGRDVLGHPLRAVTWLADHLVAQGGELHAGDVVMTGSMVTTKFPEGPGHYRFEVSGLGSVELTLTA